MRKTNRTVQRVQGALACGIAAMALLLVTIVLEIVTDIVAFVPLMFAAYTILIVSFCCITPKSRTPKETLKTIIIALGIMELVFIIPYISILLIESII